MEDKNSSKWWKMINYIDGKPPSSETIESASFFLDDEWLNGSNIAEEVNKYFITIGGAGEVE